MKTDSCHRLLRNPARWSALILALAVAGCTSAITETGMRQSVSPGHPQAAGIGKPLLVRETGSAVTQRRWSGILNTPGGWETTGSRYAGDYTREELVYLGRTGTVIGIEYRLFRPGSALPVEQETLHLDLAGSNTLAVKDLRLQILAADGETIRYVVIDD